MSVNSMPRCDFPGCDEDGTTISRLSPEGYLVATGKKAYSFREAYRRFYHKDKATFASWKRRERPDWWLDEEADYENRITR